MTTIAEIKEIGKCGLEYDRSGREWLLGRPDGKILAFPAGQEGKLAAQMSALTHDMPDVAAWIDILIQKFPQNRNLHSRLIRAGFILRDNPPTLLHRQHYFIQSQSNPATKYVVWWSRETHCGCSDWFYGNGVSRYDFDPSRPHAPHLTGLGIACKHVLAAYIYEQTTPMYDCPECDGKGFELTPYENPQLHPQTTRLYGGYCKLCKVCESKGVLFDEEISDPGPDPELERIDALSAPMPGSDEPPTIAALHGPRRRFF